MECRCVRSSAFGYDDGGRVSSNSDSGFLSTKHEGPGSNGAKGLALAAWWKILPGSQQSIPKVGGGHS